MARLVDVDELKLELKWLEVDTPVYHDVMSTIDEMPTVEPKHGHWVDMGDFESCSICNGTHLKEFQSYYGKCLWVKMDYCPNCGSKMDEVTE